MRKNMKWMLVILLILLSGCSKRNNTETEDTKIEEKGKSQFVMEYSPERTEFKQYSLMDFGVYEGKQVFPKIITNNEDSDETCNTIALGGFENGEYKKYKEFSYTDEINGKCINQLYFGKYNKIVVFSLDDQSKEYIFIHDLKDDSKSQLCIDDACKEELDKSAYNASYARNMINDNTAIFTYYNILFIYNFKTGETNYINLKDYPDSYYYLRTERIYNNFYYENGMLDIYTLSTKYRCHITRINVANKTIVKEKEYECETADHYDNYVLISKKGKYSVIDRNTFEKICDLDEYTTESAFIRYTTIGGTGIGNVVYMKDDDAYILSDNGIKSVNIVNKKEKQLKCTDGIRFQKICITDSNTLYAATLESLYLIDIKNDKLNKIGDFEEGLARIYEMDMYSDEGGFINAMYAFTEVKNDSGDTEYVPYKEIPEDEENPNTAFNEYVRFIMIKKQQ